MQQKTGKKRKLLIMLPLFVAPVVGLVLLFNGKSNETVRETEDQNAFNAALPSANLKDEGKNKLEIYMQAQKDSVKQSEALQNDPYGKSLYDPAPPIGEQEQKLQENRMLVTSSVNDMNERKVNERLDKLLKEINQPVSKEKGTENTKPNSTLQEGEAADLEKLLASIQTSNAGGDPEMNRIETVLEKVLDIQHPERVKQKLAVKKEVKTPAAYTVSALPPDAAKEGGFYGLNGEQAVTAVPDQSTILATIPEEQTIQDGSTIKLRLLQPVFVGETYIPKGSFVSGKCAFTGDRINIAVKDVAYRNRIYPVNLTVYDLDGILGINVPGAITRDFTKEGTSQTIQDVEILNTPSSVAAQAAATGIQTAKNLLTKKLKAVKATIKAGHQVLLKTATN